MDKFEALRAYFGHSSFRSGQEKLVDGILAGRDVFGLMPTGGGKSLCYQLPAMLLPGLSIVISPLISLMKDQVMSLQEAGVPAAFINSSLEPAEHRKIYAGALAGRYKLIYVAPERLEAEGFQTLCRGLDISLVAVDEAHCISQWGQDFRPSYLHIRDFIDALPTRPVIAAFTATATELVGEDILRLLSLKDPVRVATGFDRPNLFYAVREPRKKIEELFKILAQHQGKSGIVYCATRRAVEKLSASLQSRGYPAAGYHAGMPDEERKKNQEDFIYDRVPVMVATNAFGMGIDKSNVSFVIHYNMPKSLEAYYQEAGRAGRDGEQADCILLFSAADIHTAKYFIQNIGINGELEGRDLETHVKEERRRLYAMIDYCRSGSCLRGKILDYFGQEHESRCGNCENCLSDFEERDISRQAQMILSCMKRVHDKLGYWMGAAMIIKVLRGAADKKLLALGLDSLSTYGLMKDSKAAELQKYIARLEDEGYIHTDPEHGGIELCAPAGDILFRGEKLSIRLPREMGRDSGRKKKAPPLPGGGLLEALKSLRSKISKEEGVPAYIVFSNASLADMAAKAPENMEEFLNVSGVGQLKAARYGRRFLEEIQKSRKDFNTKL